MQSLVAQLSKCFLIMTFLVGGSLISTPSAHAEENPTDQNAVTVATVNVQDIQLLYQKGNEFVVGFNISNREGVQPKVIYAVNLFRKDTDGRMLFIDQKIYDNDLLNIGSNETIHKEITYDAPSYLNGEYVIAVEARSPSGMMFGWMPMSNAVLLNGSGGQIFIDQSGCFLSVDGESSDKKYNLSQGVDISLEEVLKLHCFLRSSFDSERSIIPSFQVRYRSAFGKIVDEVDQDPVSIGSNQEKEFVASLPKMSEAQAYDAILTFKDVDGNRVSSVIDSHYVLRGESATIQNLTVDKDFYRKGDRANVEFFWSGPVSDPTDSVRFSDKGSVGTDTSAVFTINDDSGNLCADSVTKVLDSGRIGGLESISIDITRDCKNPTAVLKLINKDKKLLAEASYNIQSKERHSQSDILLMAVTAVILGSVILFVVYWVRRYKYQGIKVLFLIAFGLGIFGVKDSAHAETFTVGNGSEGSGSTASITLNKSEYLPGETMTVTGHMMLFLSGNTYWKENYYIRATVNGVTKDILSGGKWGGQDYVGSADFVVPSSGGQHNVSFEIVGYLLYKTGNLPYTVTPPYVAPPTVALNASSPVSYGGVSNFTWSTTNATSCSSDAYGTGSITSGASPWLSGTWQETNITAPVTHTITCTGSGGSATASATATPGAAPVYSCLGQIPPNATWYSGDNTNVTVGSMTKYSASNTSAKCEFICNNGYDYNTSTFTCDSTAITGPAIPIVNGVCGSATNGLSASAPTTNLCSPGTASGFTEDTSSGTLKWHWYCAGSGGGTDSSLCYANGSTTSTSAPTPVINSFYATPANINSGQSSQLNWTTTDASSCMLKGGRFGAGSWTSSFAPYPNVDTSTGALTATTSYTLECWSVYGLWSGQKTATVTVSAVPSTYPVINSFYLSPDSITGGSSTVLNWSASNVTTCLFTGSGFPGVTDPGPAGYGPNGAMTIYPSPRYDVTIYYTMQCYRDRLDPSSWTEQRMIPLRITMPTSPTCTVSWGAPTCTIKTQEEACAGICGVNATRTASCTRTSAYDAACSPASKTEVTSCPSSCASIQTTCPACANTSKWKEIAPK